MNKNTLILLTIAVILPLAWWLGSPLFINRTINEALPFELPSADFAAMMLPSDLEASLSKAVSDLSQEDVMENLSDETKAKLEQEMMTLAQTLPDKPMNDAMPEDTSSSETEWQLMSQGRFAGADSAHQGSGTASIFQKTTAESLLRLEDFASTKGPDLRVLLVENPAGKNTTELGEYLDLGSLKGNMGNQNYDIPEGTDLSKYAGVMIYCMPFHVVFSSATFEN